MKERPILMSAEMVRAILEGRKTQTRRPMKPQPEPIPDGAGSPKGFWIPSNKCQTMLRNKDMVWDCPFGQPGDRLWVRETWRVGAFRGECGKVALDYVASPEITHTPWIYPPKNVVEKLIEQSISDCEQAMEDGSENISEGELPYEWEGGKSPCRNRPSIHMPRWASRILLEIADVRVERVQEISIKDALSEGITHHSMNCPRMEFAQLWNSIYGPDAWTRNDWVWAVSFKVVKS